MLPVTVFELVILPSYGKIPKILSIEFVKQSIGHRTLETTSAYVNKLSDQERQKRVDQLEY